MANQPTLKTSRARELRQNQTPYEAALWKLLRLNQVEGCHWRRQYPIGPYFADFACIRAKLIIELDGCSHDGREQADQNRDLVLKQWGWTTLRVLNRDLMSHPEGVWETIVQHLSPSLDED
jgi:adenine-specific DNA-methyltransferase